MNRLTKIFVALPNHWAGHGTETLWARKVGDDLHRLESVPFFAYGLAYGDVVRAEFAHLGAVSTDFRPKEEPA